MKILLAKIRLVLFILVGASLLAACAPQPGTVTIENYEKRSDHGFGLNKQRAL